MKKLAMLFCRRLLRAAHDSPEFMPDRPMNQLPVEKNRFTVDEEHSDSES